MCVCGKKRNISEKKIKVDALIEWKNTDFVFLRVPQ